MGVGVGVGVGVAGGVVGGGGLGSAVGGWEVISGVAVGSSVGSGLGESSGETSSEGDGEGWLVHDPVGGKGAPQVLPNGVERLLKMKLVVVGTSGSGPPGVPGPCLARAIQP